MKCFDQVDPWPYKVNYVDEKNRVLGFSMGQSCCESFGHGVFDRIPTNEDQEIKADIGDYVFADEEPSNCMPGYDAGGGLAFRIVAPNKPDLYVAIWNHHNGYYSHGWEFNGKGDSL